MQMTKNKKKSSKQNSISFLFAKKYIYFLLSFFLDRVVAIFVFKMSKKLVLIIIIIVAIELSGYGILSTLYRLFG